MYLKCLFLLVFLNNVIDGREYYSYGTCRYPSIRNGIPRLRQKGNFVRFSCRPRFILMGNKYATCRNGRWDVPLPVCVRSGCEPLEVVPNAVTQSYHFDAWVLFFCFPHHTLVGSPVIYCDGRKWNDTVPTCVDSSAITKTSCDFEDSHICGWKQDELHDFDWRRLNRRTPSSYLLTGPQYDHTLGKNGSGYYMYIESTSQDNNDTARLLSPVYEEKLAKNGCFVFYYHMYGRDIGGLRVYQKPDYMKLYEVLRYKENGTNKYMLFEQWGNQGNFWFTGVANLLDVGDDFQIVIEGIRGKSFLSDIAIDDVSIQQGVNCTNIMHDATTPQYIQEESCVGRCWTPNALKGSCGCTLVCLLDDSCCLDYLDVCEFGNNNSNSTDDIDNTTVMSSTIQLPQTQKLIGTTKTIPTTTFSTPLLIPIIKSTTPTSTLTTPTSTLTTSTSSSTTSISSSTTSTSTSIASTTKRRRVKTTINTPPTKLSTITTTLKPILTFTTPKTTKSWTLNTTTSSPKSIRPFNLTTYDFIVTSRTTPRIVRSPISSEITNNKKSVTKGTNGVISAVLVLFVAVIVCGLLYGAYKLRKPEGIAALAKLRGRATNDSEVHFFNSDVDVDIDDD